MLPYKEHIHLLYVSKLDTFSAYRLQNVLVLFIMSIFVLIESIDSVDFFNTEYDTIEF